MSFSADERALLANGAVNGTSHTLTNGNGTSLHLPPPPSQTPSPAPSQMSIADDSPPRVTVAMLRALSKSVLKERRPRT
jgi:hypothetical protein